MFLQILMAMSFLIAGYQDVRERLVSDIVWVPAIIGVVLAFYFVPSQDLYLLIRIVIVGAIALAATMYGLVGEADSIALVLVVAQPVALDLVLLLFAVTFAFVGGVVLAFFRGFLFKKKVIGIRQFKAEARWIPRAIIVGGERRDIGKNVNISREEVEKVTDESAMVEVEYGMPNVTYIAAGYVIYIIFLAIFQSNVLLTLP